MEDEGKVVTTGGVKEGRKGVIGGGIKNFKFKLLTFKITILKLYYCMRMMAVSNDGRGVYK